MRNTPKRNQQGSLKWIIILAMGIIIASYFFDFSLQEAIEDEQTQSNWEYIRTNLIQFYETYLEEYVEIFTNFFLEYIWEPLTENFENLRSGEPTVFDEAAQEQAEFLETT